MLSSGYLKKKKTFFLHQRCSVLVIKQMIFSSTPWEVNAPGTRLNRKFSFNCPPPWSLPALTRGSHKLRLLVMATLVLHNVVNLTIDSTTFFVHILFKVCIVLISFVMHLVFMIRFCKLRLMHFYRYLVYIHIRNLFFPCIYFIKCKHSFAVKSPQQAMESTLPFTIFLLSQTMHNAFPSPSISIRHVSFHHVGYLHHTAPATQSSSVCKFACSTSSLLLLLLQGGAYLWEGLRDIQALVRKAGVKSRRPTGKGFGDLRL